MMGGMSVGWMWLWGTLMMISFAVLIVWLVRAGRGSTDPAIRNPTGRGREILAERFARGEISADEYQDRLGELE